MEDMEDTGLPSATFDEMEIAIDNRSIVGFCNYLNDGNFAEAACYVLQYAIYEMGVFKSDGAELQPGQLKQFVDIALDCVEKRAYSVRMNITEVARGLISDIKELASEIDEEFVRDFNNSSFARCIDPSKYIRKENDEMNDETMKNDHCCCGAGADGSEHCDKECGTGTDELFDDCVDELRECDYSGIGDVYHAPIINFNAPIINLGGDSIDVLDKVRDLLLDFYNTKS